MKSVQLAINDNPAISGLLGSVTSYVFYMIDIPKTTAMLELIGAAVKDVGILAGSILAVASFIAYVKKNWLKRSHKGAKTAAEAGFPEWLHPGKPVIFLDGKEGQIKMTEKCWDVEQGSIIQTGGFKVSVMFLDGSGPVTCYASSLKQP